MAYKLYFGTVFRQPKGVKYCFYSSSSGKVLIYGEEKKYKGFSEVLDENILSSEEKHWLAESKIKVASEYIKKNKEEIEKRANVFLDAWEEELKKEEERQSNGCNP